MPVSYQKLWYLLLDMHMKKKEFEEKVQMLNYAMKKLAKNKNISTEVLSKICKTLNCSLDDIVEFINEDKWVIYI